MVSVLGSVGTSFATAALPPALGTPRLGTPRLGTPRLEAPMPARAGRAGVPPDQQARWD